MHSQGQSCDALLPLGKKWIAHSPPPSRNLSLTISSVEKALRYTKTSICKGFVIPNLAISWFLGVFLTIRRWDTFHEMIQ